MISFMISHHWYRQWLSKVWDANIYFTCWPTLIQLGLRKMPNPGSPNGPPMIDGWVVHLSSGGPSINNVLRLWNQLKMVRMSQSTSAFYLGIITNRHMISVESYVQFHSEIFSAKHNEFIGCQTDHRWWDLGSPGGFMGHIWRPGARLTKT